jgi:hypothetical protein
MCDSRYQDDKEWTGVKPWVETKRKECPTEKMQRCDDTESLYVQSFDFGDIEEGGG